MPNEGPEKKERKRTKIETGDMVRFVPEAPDGMFPPFERDREYMAGLVRASTVELANPTGSAPLLIPIQKKWLVRIGDEDTKH